MIANFKAVKDIRAGAGDLKHFFDSKTKLDFAAAVSLACLFDSKTPSSVIIGGRFYLEEYQLPLYAMPAGAARYSRTHSLELRTTGGWKCSMQLLLATIQQLKHL